MLIQNLLSNEGQRPQYRLRYWSAYTLIKLGSFSVCCANVGWNLFRSVCLDLKNFTQNTFALEFT